MCKALTLFVMEHCASNVRLFPLIYIYTHIFFVYKIYPIIFGSDAAIGKIYMATYFLRQYMHTFPKL